MWNGMWLRSLVKYQRARPSLKSPLRSSGPCTLSAIDTDAISSTPPRQFCVTEATSRRGAQIDPPKSGGT